MKLFLSHKVCFKNPNFPVYVGQQMDVFIDG
jgi:hypothetical protein